MKKTIEQIRETISKETKSFIIWNKEDLFPIMDHAIIMDFIAVFISISGRMELEINKKRVIFEKDCILTYTYKHASRIISRSPDFVCIGVLFYPNYWEKIIIEAHHYNILASIFPCIHVTQQSLDTMIKYYNVLRQHYKDAGNNNLVIRDFVIDMFYELGNCYKGSVCFNTTSERQEKLLCKFLCLIKTYFREHRDVAFYADQLAVDQRYFTTIIRKMTGMSALKWIEKYVSMEARIMLRNTDLAIKEIAANLNFEDSSFFSKYFKRTTGMTPEEYRNMTE